MTDHLEISPSALSLEAVVAHVRADAAGAISTFVGVTRDTFEGKKVSTLEYECYDAMALKTMRALCRLARLRWDGLLRIAIAHRVGVVGVGETSVIIAASSAHRADAIEAVGWMIDELKATVPIWKKETFEGGEVWKENDGTQRREPAPPLPPP